MNRHCLVAVLGILVHQGLVSLPAADHYLKVVDESLEDGADLHTIDAVLETLND